MSTSKLSSFALFTLSMSLLACGGDEDKASDKCESLVTTYCDHIVDCANKDDLLSADFTASELRNECEKTARQSAMCSDAVSVSKTFNDCIDDATALSCSVINNQLLGTLDVDERYIDILPSSCRGAVLYQND